MSVDTLWHEPLTSSTEESVQGQSLDPVPLEVQNLSCVRGDRQLFSGLNFTVQLGNLILIEGPNGSGKTSLLRILCGLMPPVEGSVLWYGQDTTWVRQEFMAEMVYLGHAHGLKGDLTPYENLRITQVLAGTKKQAMFIEEALAQVELLGYEDVPTRVLSAGQRRRVALARLLLMPACLWVLDEPFTALDARGIRLVEQMLSRHLAQRGMAVVSTHQPVDVGSVPVKRLDLWS